MKKLLSIITSLTVAASATSSLISCKVITNSFEIEIVNWKDAGDLTYKFNKDTGLYEVKKDFPSEDKTKITNVKKALDGASGTFASALVADMINAVFFNADLSVTKNSKKTWQYLFRTSEENVYVDGQFRTAGLNSQQTKEIDEYYKKTKNISSLLGLVQYSKWSNSSASTYDSESKIKVLTDLQIDEIEKSKMFESSNNQGITKVEIKSSPTKYNGTIGLGEKEKDTSEISKYESPYISKETNFNEKTANDTKEDDASKGYAEYVFGTNLAYDFFSQLLISTIDESPELPITVKKVEKQSDESKENVKKQGLILNSKSEAKADQPIVFEYTENDKDEKKQYAYGYSLVSMQPIDLEITYNDNIDLKTKEAKGTNYVIDLTIDGISAAFKPVLSFTSNKVLKDGKETPSETNGTPYIGWRFMGYQFNSKNIVGYNEDGTLFTEKAPNKKMPALNKKFDDFNISELTFKKVEG